MGGGNAGAPAGATGAVIGSATVTGSGPGGSAGGAGGAIGGGAAGGTAATRSAAAVRSAGCSATLGAGAASATGAGAAAARAAASAATTGATTAAGARSGAGLSVAMPGLLAAARWRAMSAAPSATECFGWASAATGTRRRSATIWLTSGIRDEPPTRRTEWRSDGETLAAASARPSASTLEVMPGRSMSSNSARVRRTSVCTFGRATAIDTAVSVDSASLASMQSRRSCTTAEIAAVSVGSRRRDLAVEGHVDVVEDRLVEVDAAEPLDALGRAEHLPAAGGPAEDRGVERAAPEVVDRDDLAGFEPFVRGVVDRRRLGLGEQRGRAALVEPGHADRLVQEIGLERSPVGRVGHDRVVGLAHLERHHLVHDRAQHDPRERVGRHRRAADDQRHRITDAPLELARDLAGIGGGPSHRRVADHDVVATAEVHDRRDAPARAKPRGAISARPSRPTATAVKVVPTSIPRV